jgi:TolA-binding protein
VKKHLPVFLSWTAIALACLWFATQTPEKVYMLGHKAMQAGRNAEAATLFTRAFERRRSPAKKEEALFWLAKTTQLAGQKEESLKRYLHLVENYHGFWVPESLYNCVMLGREVGQSAGVESCGARLKEEYPNNSWTGKLGEIR